MAGGHGIDDEQGGGRARLCFQNRNKRGGEGGSSDLGFAGVRGGRLVGVQGRPDRRHVATAGHGAMDAVPRSPMNRRRKKTRAIWAGLPL